MLTFNEAYDAVAQFQFGKDIAQFLKEQNVKGLAGGITSCPLAVWMRDQTGLNVRVNYATLRVLNTDTGSNSDHAFIEQNTPAMQEFMKKFDSGSYDYLHSDNSDGRAGINPVDC